MANGTIEVEWKSKRGFGQFSLPHVFHSSGTLLSFIFTNWLPGTGYDSMRKYNITKWVLFNQVLLNWNHVIIVITMADQSKANLSRRQWELKMNTSLKCRKAEETKSQLLLVLHLISEESGPNCLSWSRS